jgi:hypothetical protein
MPYIDAMSSSSQENSPNSTTGSGRHFSMSRDKFDIGIPSPRLSIVTNGDLMSPNSLKSPTGRRMSTFSREGILGSAQKARNLSQCSADRESTTNGLQSRQNQTQNQNSEETGNPLKRRSTDAGIDYPRRRATIAVSSCSRKVQALLILYTSVRYVGLESQGVMEQSPNASFAQSWARSAFIESLV